MKYPRPRGTKDYLPPESYERRLVLEKAREIFELYGYGEIVTPAFERLELLEAKAGPEIKEQIYWFKDKGGRLLGLRFDVTTSVARVVASNPTLPKPIRFYYIAPVWRYEEPQRGRLREFWQAGVELIGSPEVDADAEVIALTRRFFKELRLRKVTVRLNDRRVAEALALKYGATSKKEEFFRALDKLYKQGEEGVTSELIRLGFSRESIDGILNFITLSGPPLSVLREGMEELKEFKEGVEGLKSMEELILTLVDHYGLTEEILKVDFSIVRGIGYYTGLVFEFLYEGEGEMRNLALAGGGRYDNLIELCGGPELPATGMSIGVERVMKALKDAGLLNAPPPQADVIVIPVNEGLRRASVRIAETLRDEGIGAIVDVNRRSLRKLLEYADKNEIRYAIIVGPKEYKEGMVVLKDLKSRSQKEVKLRDLSVELRKG